MPARILIVEDEMLVAMDLECVLEELGHEPVGIVPDLQSAEEFFDIPLDLALVDLNLRDGCTGPQIGARLGAQGVSVVFVTANPGLLTGNVVGAIGVITKPTDEKIVRATVDYALARRNGRDANPPMNMRLFG
jgi:DNA-binding response OmpR family regulator